MVLSHEGRLEFKKLIDPDMSVNYAANYKRKNQYNNKVNPPVRGKGRGRWNNNNRPNCQICEKVGHAAVKCYFRLNRNYTLGQSSTNQDMAILVQIWNKYKKAKVII